MKKISLGRDVEIPAVGLGVFRTKSGEETENAVRWALDAGYRHIDTAAAYRNEESVGKAIRESGVDRKDIFLTTKLWNGEIRAGNTRQAFFDALKRLDTDYVDLYLIHWPADGFEQAWLEMEKLYDEGYIRAIGVSNFHVHHLDALKGKYTPCVDQIESHPYFSNQELIDELHKRGIHPEVWSPMAGGNHAHELLNDPVILEVAAKHGITAAQAVLRWHLQRDVIVIPKSVHQDRIISNLDLFSFELDDEDMKKISSLNRNVRVGADPDNFDF